jgi:hypothetical protein
VQKTLLIIATWAVTVAISVLGVNAGATIWFYMEPAMGSIDEPASYSVAVYSGLVALALSIVVSIGISIHLLRCKKVVVAHQ